MLVLVGRVHRVPQHVQPVLPPCECCCCDAVGWAIDVCIISTTRCERVVLACWRRRLRQATAGFPTDGTCSPARVRVMLPRFFAVCSC